MSVLVYEKPDELSQEVQKFMDFYNARHYRYALGNVMLDDECFGTRQSIFERREKLRLTTLEK